MNKIVVKEIALETNVPKPFLSKILQQLVSKGFVCSSKGRNGGFYITQEHLKTSLLDIIIEIEGKDVFRQCVVNFENCDDQNPCKIHDLMVEAKEAMRNRFKAVSLNDLKSRR